MGQGSDLKEYRVRGLFDAGNILFLDQGMVTLMCSAYENLTTANL